MKRWLLLVLCIICLVQLAVPVGMIARREYTLRHGEVFLFKTQPVDPYDAFRGRYVALNFEASTFSHATNSVTLTRKQSCYAELGRDADGFARVIALHEEKPEAVHIPVRIQWTSEDTTRLVLPMDRFYLTESLAPEAERLYREHSTRDSSNTYAVVSVWKGFPVVTDLIINGRPVREYDPSESF